MEYLDSLIIIEVEIFARGNLYQITINLFGISDTSHIVYRHISSLLFKYKSLEKKKKKKENTSIISSLSCVAR